MRGNEKNRWNNDSTQSVSADLENGRAENEIGTDTENLRQSGRLNEGHLTFCGKVGGPLGER